MNSMVKSLQNFKGFNWEIGKKTEKNAKVLYLIGLPKNKEN